MEEKQMAKTWTIREAYNAIKAGDKDAIADFGKRFPLVTTALAQAGSNAGLDAFMNALPDRVTTRTVEMVLKEGVQPVDEDAEVEEVAEEKPVKGNKKSAKTEKPVAKKGKAKKEEVIEDDDDDEDVEEIEEEIDDEEEDDEDAVDYSSMNAIELFNLCKKRGIKVEPKKKASVYIKALEADDAKADEEDDEEWDEEEEVEEKPAKKSKATKPAKAEKPAKSTKKKVEDDDDEWDI